MLGHPFSQPQNYIKILRDHQLRRKRVVKYRECHPCIVIEHRPYQPTITTPHVISLSDIMRGTLDCVSLCVLGLERRIEEVEAILLGIQRNDLLIYSFMWSPSGPVITLTSSCGGNRPCSTFASISNRPPILVNHVLAALAPPAEPRGPQFKSAPSQSARSTAGADRRSRRFGQFRE